MSTQPAAASSESARVGRIVKTTAASSPSHFDLPAQVWSVVMESPANSAAPQSGGGDGAVKQYALLFYQRQEDADAESACVQGRQEDQGITEGRRNRSLGGVRRMDKRQMGALGIGNVAGYYAPVEGQAPVAQGPRSLVINVEVGPGRSVPVVVYEVGAARAHGVLGCQAQRAP